MKAEEGGAKKSEPGTRRAEARISECPTDEEVDEHSQEEMQRPLRNVKGKGIQSAVPVVQSEGKARQRAVCGVGRQAGESRRVLKEERDVLQASQVRVVLNDRAVVEVEGVVEVIGVRAEDSGDGQKREDGQSASRRSRALFPGGGFVWDRGVPLSRPSLGSAQKDSWD